MKVLLFTGIAIVLLSAAVYAEESFECPLDLSDFTTVEDSDPEASTNALCDGCPCCTAIKQVKRGCNCAGGDQCKYGCYFSVYVNSGQSPPPSCKCHYRLLRREQRCRKSNSCWPCNVGDVATIPEIMEERGG